LIIIIIIRIRIRRRRRRRRRKKEEEIIEKRNSQFKLGCTGFSKSLQNQSLM